MLWEMHNASGPDRHIFDQALNRLRSTPEGSRCARRMAKQMKFAEDNGLLPGSQ
jgi:hypothetical protein